MFNQSKVEARQMINNQIDIKTEVREMRKKLIVALTGGDAVCGFGIQSQNNFG